MGNAGKSGSRLTTLDATNSIMRHGIRHKISPATSGRISSLARWAPHSITIYALHRHAFGVPRAGLQDSTALSIFWSGRYPSKPCDVTFPHRTRAEEALDFEVGLEARLQRDAVVLGVLVSATACVSQPWNVRKPSSTSSPSCAPAHEERTRGRHRPLALIQIAGRLCPGKELSITSTRHCAVEALLRGEYRA